MKELAEFSGELSQEGLRFWKMAFSAMTRPAAAIVSSPPDAEAAEELVSSSASNKKVILLPCRNPPSRECVQLWLEARRQYESLQNRRRDGIPSKMGQPAGSACPALKVEQGENQNRIRTQRRRNLNLSLNVTPVRNTGSQCGSTEQSPVSEDGSSGDKDEDPKSTSPDSPDLPPWQQSVQPSSPDTNRLSDLNRTPTERSPGIPNLKEGVGGANSPSSLHGSDVEDDGASPRLNCTPFSRKRRRFMEDQDPMCSTPISEGESRVCMKYL